MIAKREIIFRNDLCSITGTVIQVNNIDYNYENVQDLAFRINFAEFELNFGNLLEEFFSVNDVPVNNSMLKHKFRNIIPYTTKINNSPSVILIFESLYFDSVHYLKSCLLYTSPSPRDS